MGLMERSLDLQIESAPPWVCKDLAELQDEYKQSAICDFNSVEGFIPAEPGLLNADVFEQHETQHDTLVATWWKFWFTRIP